MIMASRLGKMIPAAINFPGWIGNDGVISEGTHTHIVHLRVTEIGAILQKAQVLTVARVASKVTLQDSRISSFY